jgi:molecular chaperone DnaJ
MRPIRRQADAHAVLGVQPGATRSEIRRAYRRRALEIHPDVAATDTTADMAALNQARDELLGAAPGTGAPADDRAPASRSAGPQRPASKPGYDHAPAWDDYWSAWNDPPRRPSR